MGYKVIWDSHGVTKRFSGHVTSQELMESSSIVQADERFEDLSFVILDFQDCTSHTVSDPVLLEIAAIDEAASATSQRFGRAKIRVAIVARDSGILELAKHYGNYRLNAVSTGIFFTREDARAWLDSRR